MFLLIKSNAHNSNNVKHRKWNLDFEGHDVPDSGEKGGGWWF